MAINFSGLKRLKAASAAALMLATAPANAVSDGQHHKSKPGDLPDFLRDDIGTGVAPPTAQAPRAPQITEPFLPQGYNHGPGQLDVQGNGYLAKVDSWNNGGVHAHLTTDGGATIDAWGYRAEDGSYKLNTIKIGSVRYVAIQGEPDHFRKTIAINQSNGFLHSTDRDVSLSDEPPVSQARFALAKDALARGGEALHAAMNPQAGTSADPQGHYVRPPYERVANESDFKDYQIIAGGYQLTKNVAYVGSRDNIVIQEVGYDVGGAHVSVNIRYDFGAIGYPFTMTGSVSGNSKFAGGQFTGRGLADYSTPIKDFYISSSQARDGGYNVPRAAIPPELAPLAVTIQTDHGLREHMTGQNPLKSATVGVVVDGLKGIATSILGGGHKKGPRPSGP